MSGNNGKAKYYVLMEALKSDILSGKINPGDRIPSENQLTKQYGVSRHTVRKALSILGNEGFVVAEHGKGTFCANFRSSRTSSHNIAVITTYISDYIFPRLIQGIDKILTLNEYSIILKNTGNSQRNEAKILEDILTKNIDGLIIEPSKSEILCRHMNLYELLDQANIPYVFIQGVYPQMIEKPSILMDDVQGSYLLTKYLIELGHKQIAGIFKVDDVQGSKRHKGYVKALQEGGFLYDPDLVIWFHTEDRHTKPMTSLKILIDEGINFDAVVCYNDQTALEIIRMLNQCGKQVPEDISVTGYDNSIIAENGPVKLTTISHPKEVLGEMAAQLLIEKINGVHEKDSKVARIVEPSMVIRESCKDRRN